MRTHNYTTAAGAALVVLLFGASHAQAQSAPSLGNAESFGVLAGSAVTNTGSSVIGGNVGVSPGAAITGFPPGTVAAGRSLNAGNAAAANAQTSLTTAYNNLAGQASTQNLTGQDLGGLTLTPGVYTFNVAAGLTGTLVLDAQENDNAVFIFQIGSTLTTASNSRVTLINGGSLCNIFWQVGSSATLGTSTAFVGNILALTSITLNTGATVAGRALARNGAVTLDTNTTSAAACTSANGAQPAGCPVVGLTPVTAPNANVGVPYSQQFTGNSGTAPYVYTTNTGALPAGLLMSSTGLLSGTPTFQVAQSFNVRATDALGCFAQRRYTILFGTAVPTLPQVFTVMLGFGLLVLGYLRLQRRRSAI